MEEEGMEKENEVEEIIRQRLDRGEGVGGEGGEAMQEEMWEVDRWRWRKHEMEVGEKKMWMQGEHGGGEGGEVEQ